MISIDEIFRKRNKQYVYNVENYILLNKKKLILHNILFIFIDVFIINLLSLTLSKNAFLKIILTNIVEIENFVIFDIITLLDANNINYSILTLISYSISISLISYVTRLKVLTFCI